MNSLVEGVYIDTIEVVVEGETHTLSVWKNPESGLITALDTMELPASNRFFYDPYTSQRVLVADTFTGLPL